MANTFHADNPLNRFLYKFGTMILINIYFLLCCLPVITIGASFTAANTVCYKMHEEPDVKVTSTFFKTFGKNFIDSTLVWIILAGIMSFAVFTFIKNAQTGGTAAVVICAVCVIAVIIAMSGASFIFTIIGRYDNPIQTQIANAYKIGISHLSWCIIIWLMWGVPIAVFASFPVLLQYLGWIWLIVGVALLIYATTGIYRKIFRKIETKE